MPNKPFKYMKLGPHDDVENDEYFKAIKQGIKDKEVSNIALTGPYGSGKSSILKTFKKNNKQYKFLNISLASFNESQIVTESNDSKEKQNNKGKQNKIVSNLIQENILKQIFYQVKSEKLPFSRFKRINNKKNESFIMDTIVFSIWVISFLILFKPELINLAITSTIIPDFINRTSIKKLASISFLSLSIYFLYKLYFLIYTKIKFLRIKFLDTELEINTEEDSSVLNKNSDELLYLFEVTNYDVVIIEDLDRFENIDIFTKLRELNDMINNANNIDRNINFIYALRDDLFNEFSDRLKFFDMIIPVVPIVDSTNSANEINSIVEKYNFNLDTKFINEISSYINDMRLIKNIFNEFNIYSNNLDSSLDKNVLFGFITYKNKHPKDYSSLFKEESLINDSFDEKNKSIQKKIKSIKEKIKSKNKLLDKIEDETIENIKELRLICGSKILMKSGGNRIELGKNNKYKLDQFKKDKIFEKFLECENVYSITSSRGNRNRKRIDKKEILESLNYDKRKKIIKMKSKEKKEKIKKEISELKDEKEFIRNCSFEKFYNNFASSDFFNDNDYKNNDLLKYLLIHGYITENTYDNYISYLDKSNITVRDNKFIMKVLSGQNLDFSYELNKVNKIVNRLNSDTFSKKEVLNYDLLKYLVKKKNKHKHYFKLIMRQLGDNTKESIEFIEGFINISDENIIKDFLNKLAKTWQNYWEYIIKESNYSTKTKKEHLIWTLKYVDQQDIINLNKNNLLKKYIEKQSDIINTSVENNIINKTKKIIKELKVKFDDLKIDLIEEKNSQKKELFNFIYKNNFYKINISMIYKIIKNITLEKDIDLEISTKNYTTILDNKLDCLNKYLKDNINDYIEKVFLKLENNKEEEGKTLVKLLNNEDLKLINKKKILDKSKNKISYLNSVNYLEIYDYLFKNNMIESNWINILTYYKSCDKELNKVLVDFINKKANYSKLKKIKTNDKNFKDLLSEKNIKIFIQKLFEYKNINLKTVHKLTENIDWKYSKLNFKNLDKEKLKTLIQQEKLILTPSNYNTIKSLNHLKNLHILLLSFNNQKFLNEISKYNLDIQDVIKILNSNKFNKNIKKQILNSIDFKILLNSNNIKPENLKTILSLLEDLGSKVQLLAKYVPKLDFDEITMMLNTLGKDYSSLTKLRKRPKIENKNYNPALLEALDKKDYISKFEKMENKLKVVNRYP